MTDDRSDIKQQIFTVFCMYLGYGCFMVLKTASSTASVSIVNEGLFDLKQWGQIVAIGTFGGILGKFLTGWMADRFGGKFTFALGLLITSVALLFFALGSSVWLFGLALFVVYLAKAAGWPAMAKLIGNWFRPNQYGKVWGILSTSSRCGTIVATLCLGAILTWLTWRWMLVVTAGVGILVVLLCMFGLKERPLAGSPSEEPGPSGDEPEPEKDPHPLDGTSLSKALSRFAGSLRFWLITGSLMGLTILMDFMNFIPMYLNQQIGLAENQAGMAASAFPFGSFVSVLVMGYVYDRFSRRKVSVLMGISLMLATGAILAMYLLPDWSLEQDSEVALSVGLLFVFGFCVSPCYYLPMSVFSIEFGGIHSGFLIALLDALGFAASMIFAWNAGSIQELWGWDGIMGALLAVSVWSIVATVLFLLQEARVRGAARD
jgi:OPA family sugar phosphate sensor protein UhpC-like MFS transporter